MKKAVLILLILFLLPVTFAATIEGTIYNLNLEIVDQAIVEINTEPIQKILTDGTYSLEVFEGEYLLTAYFEETYIEEDVLIKKEGNYKIDLFLFPDTREEEEIFDEPYSVDKLYDNGNKNYWWFLLLLILFLPFLFKKKKTETDPLEEKVYSIIKKEKRITQKELRKLIPFSEAKISLMVSELEHKGVLKKIKKGRGNIIVLVKKK